MQVISRLNFLTKIFHVYLSRQRRHEVINMYTYGRLREDIDRLSSSGFGGVLDIGLLCRTAYGREVPALKIGHGKKRVLYIGAHHGMEYITSALLMDFASALCRLVCCGENCFPHSVDTMSGQRIAANYSFYIIPMLNPDGVTICCEGIESALSCCGTVKREEYRLLLKKAAAAFLENSARDLSEKPFRGEKDVYKRWQANGRGVDLNHNYSAGFAEYKRMELRDGKAYPAPTRYSGDYPESERESAALCSFIRSMELHLMLTFHSQGGELYGNDFYSGGNVRDHYIPGSGCEPDPLRLVKEGGNGGDILKHIADGYSVRGTTRSVGRYIEKTSGYVRSVPEGAAAYGGLTDWYTDFYRRPAYTVEVGRGRNPLPMSALAEIKKELLYSLLTAPIVI